MSNDIASFLAQKVKEYNRASFIPKDPVKYDFALFSLGVIEKFN